MKENNNFFEAVSKITNVENNNKTEIYKIYEKLYVLINEKLKTILSKIWDDDKWSLKNSVDCVITEIEMFMRYPFIYNKICIGILDNRNKKINNYLLSLSVEDDYFAYMQQRIIPTIIYNDKNINKILVTNNSGNIVKLSIKELKYFLELNKKLKFDKLAKSCAITAKLNSDNICYINLPQQNSYNFSNDDMEFTTNIRQQNCLENCRESLMNALVSARNRELQDLISIDLKSSLLFLDEITGEVITDEILNNIFEHFCIGK